MFQSIRSYVPDEFRDDPMYAKPSERQQENAKTAKQVRRTQRAAMAVAAKRNQDQRGRESADDSVKTPAAKTPHSQAKKRKTTE
ncbi:hypothetical protein F443_14451 [Phytophthora nicotianae P1569]|uniref:Uncharacterized protein n=1 Tax=Phytophthora nicotianae P1569 TaxID=1317065 RepID=V9ELF9_PHYNI|nr:hypothetical protein F443_14451 [Phytophthora nicotianae P1569]